MIPDFLSQFSSELEKFKLKSIHIEATPLDFKPVLEIKRSKFLGLPYLPLHQSYPMASDGKPMILIAQLNFAEIPALEKFPDSGILQLFLEPNDWYEDDRYKILFHENVNEEYHTDFSFLKDELFDESPVMKEHSLIFTQVEEYGGIEDVRFNMDFDGQPYYEYMETLSEYHAEEFMKFLSGSGHKIGGYGAFTQDDPRDFSSDGKSTDIQLFQMDTDEEIMFGDSGIAHIFISPDDLKNRRFDNAYFYWDCC